MSARVTAAEILRRFVDPASLELADAVRQKTGQSTLLVLLDLELVDGERLAASLAEALGLERFSPVSTPSDPAALFVLDRDFARDHSCYPVSFDAGHLLLAMVDPLDSSVVEQVADAAGYPVRPLVATRADLEAALARWDTQSHEIMGPEGTIVGSPTLAIPTAVFLGYPDGVGVTSLIWNLAYLIGRTRSVLLVSIGGPAEYAKDMEPLPRLGSYLAVVPEASLVPDRLADVAEQAELGRAPRFDCALAEIDRPTFAVDAHQVALWARTIILVTDPEHAGVSWDLVEQMYGGALARGVSVGVIMNRTSSQELADVGMAALEAALRAGGLSGAIRLWAAGSLPYAPDAFQQAERNGTLIAEALPRHPLTRALKEVARTVLAKTVGND